MKKRLGRTELEQRAGVVLVNVSETGTTVEYDMHKKSRRQDLGTASTYSASRERLLREVGIGYLESRIPK